MKRYRPNDQAALRLICFPHAGGGLAVFRDWPRALPPFVDLCSVELPGRDRLIGEPPLRSLPPLVERLSSALDMFLGGPYALFGNSMGALLSFELARRARHSPAALLVAAHRAPQLPDPREPMHTRPDAEFLAELRRLDGTPPAVLNDAELMNIYLPTLKADCALSETYRYTPGPPLHCPIFAFGGRDDPEVTMPEIDAWREQTSGPFTLQMLAGGHFVIHTSAAPLLAAISEALIAIAT